MTAAVIWSNCCEKPISCMIDCVQYLLSAFRNIRYMYHKTSLMAKYIMHFDY